METKNISPWLDGKRSTGESLATMDAVSNENESHETWEDIVRGTKNLFYRVFSMRNMKNAYREAAAGRRYQREVLNFGYDAWTSLRDLQSDVLSGRYDIDQYHVFYVHEPKKRMIMSISFKHRVIQWAIYRVLNPYFVKTYVTDSYGCIPGRGSLTAVKNLSSWVNYVSKKEKPWYYLKLDISKYFYRVDHEVLKRILRKKISDSKLLEVLYKIIDCKHMPFGLPAGKSPEEVELKDRLFDVGMPIGNLLSQMFANIYLNELDQYCKRVLGVTYYERYMDDIMILSDDKAKLHEWKRLIEGFLENELHLSLNKKTCIRPINQGMEFVGYRIFPDHVQLRKSTTLRITRALRGVCELYSRNKLDFDDVTQTFSSYLGMLEHTDSDEFVCKMYDEVVLNRMSVYSDEDLKAA